PDARLVVGSEMRDKAQARRRLDPAPKHQCDWCKKLFTRKNSCKDHTLRHENRRTFICNHVGCTARCNTRGGLRSHLRICHGAGATGKKGE
ncbi:hypothetical protein EV714DRAFT_188909, partial [Schizophyllum commune]